jgi:hypothetical protein
MDDNKPSLPHGIIVGVATCGVIGYNNNPDHISTENSEELYDPVSYVNDSRGRLRYAGAKWQCVEFARRWWISELDVYLPMVPRACDIYTNLTKVKNLSTEKITYVGLLMLAQGETLSRPEVHDAVIWKRTDNAPVGHIAVVSEVTDEYVCVAEQNVDNNVMWKGGHYARKFPLVKNAETGAWSIVDEVDPILGWVRVNKNTDEDGPLWNKPTTDQLPITDEFNDDIQKALENFVGTTRPSHFTPELWTKMKPFFSRLTDYGLVAFLNTRHSSYPMVSLPWKGFGPEMFDRTPLIRKLQSFLNAHPAMSGVGADLEIVEHGEWDRATNIGVINMLNKVHTADEFESALEVYVL